MSKILLTAELRMKKTAPGRAKNPRLIIRRMSISWILNYMVTSPCCSFREFPGCAPQIRPGLKKKMGNKPASDLTNLLTSILDVTHPQTPKCFGIVFSFNS